MVIFIVTISSSIIITINTIAIDINIPLIGHIIGFIGFQSTTPAWPAAQRRACAKTFPAQQACCAWLAWTCVLLREEVFLVALAHGPISIPVARLWEATLAKSGNRRGFMLWASGSRIWTQASDGLKSTSTGRAKTKSSNFLTLRVKDSSIVSGPIVVRENNKPRAR